MTTTFAALWDMDGVLVDSGELHFQSWVETLKAYGYPFPYEFHIKTFGLNNTTILTQVFGHTPAPELVDEISDKKESWYRHAIHGQALPMPGVVDWLKQLKAWGFRQAVASSAPMENITTVIEELGLLSYFDALVSAERNMPGKPNPAVFLEAARRVGADPAHSVVFEDAVAGVAAAKAAEMKCIAVLTTNPASALQAADRITSTLADLRPSCLLELFPTLRVDPQE